MQFITQLLGLLILFLALNAATQNVRFVKPSDSSHEECPEPCLSINQYTEQQSTYITTGTTFFFLTGNYTLETTIQLLNISDVTFAGRDNESDVTIFYGSHDAIQCVNVTNFQIRRLKFVSNTTPTIGSVSSSALTLFQSKSVLILDSTFRGSSNITTLFGLLNIKTNSDVVVLNCHFNSNSAQQGGGISVSESNLTLDGCIFIANRATLGGAIYAEQSKLKINVFNGNSFAHNIAINSGGAIYCIGCVIDIVSQNNVTEGVSKLSVSTVILEQHHVYFLNNSAGLYGGAVALVKSSKLTSNAPFLYFVSNRVDSFGGAIHAQINISITLGTRNTTQYFIGNEGAFGGAVYFQSGGSLTINGSTFFTNNSAYNGGVLNAVLGGNVIMNGRTFFRGNHARWNGGAVHSVRSPVIFTGDFVGFTHSSSPNFGGAIFQLQSLLVIHTTESNFINNSAGTGGGISSSQSRFLAVTSHLTFSGNSAELGSAIHSFRGTEHRVGSAVFTKNSNGVIFIDEEDNTIYHNITAVSNLGLVMFIRESQVNISGYTVINQNLGEGIYLLNSILFLLDYTEFKGNVAAIGAAISSVYGSELYLYGENIFENNTAVNGGSFFMFESTVTLAGIANFTANSAQRGGAMFLALSTLNMEQNSSLITSHNSASENGGAIYHRDAITTDQCEFNMSLSSVLPGGVAVNPLSVILPQCFLNLKELSTDISSSVTILSINNSADINGNFLFGGQLDRCRITATTIPIVSYQFFRQLFQIRSTNNNITDISSRPYQLCFCESGQTNSCLSLKSIKVHRGQGFTLPLIAYGQGTTPISTQVTAIIQKTASLNLNQSLQTLSQNCSHRTYNLYSTKSYETLTLYIDGPCRDTGVARAVVNVVLLPCPDAFNKVGDRCECESRLQVYDADCFIHSEKKIFVKRRTATSILFWMNTLYVNGSYHGLVLYPTCPPEFCRTEPVEILLDDLDSQCNNHRSGKLCGACSANYSLVFGSSQCHMCSNHYLSLLLVFAAAGILLVTLLTLLRLTVAIGLINSVILYANILQVNKTVFFPGTTNILTVFIAWMNLDFGFPVCFYNGMDAYVQTWLQFAFPLYIWVIISMIILLSRYSIIVSRLIGHNPIAVLATLILMAYTKILKIIIEVYSFVELEYPENRTSTVWLKDANVPYFETKHLVLTLFTSLILAFLFLPYTAVLLVGYKLYHFSGRKQFKWLLKIKPLLDSYYAPYSVSTRYWTGLILLVRCVLYTIFSFNSLGGTSKSLMAIVLTFSAIVVIANGCLSIKIYKNNVINIIETSIYMNLIVLSTATLANVNSSELTYFFVGVVFATMMGIIVYHFHISYTVRSPKWPVIKQKIMKLKGQITIKRATPLPPPLPASTSSHDPHKIVTHSVIPFRESLLEYS